MDMYEYNHMIANEKAHRQARLKDPNPDKPGLKIED